MSATLMPGGPGRRRGVRRPRAARSRSSIADGHHARARHDPRRRRRRQRALRRHEAWRRRAELGWTSPHVHLPEDATQADVRRRDPRVQRRSRGRRVPRAAPDAAADRLRRRAARDRSRQGRRRHAPGQPGPPRADDARARCRARPPGIEALLAYYEIPVAGHEVCILGRGTTLGRPLALLLSQKRPDRQRRGHRRAHRRARLAAVHAARRASSSPPPACPGILQPEHITPGRGRRRRRRALRGPQAAPRRRRARARRSPGAITPRVGGVGPTTIAMLFRNAVEAAERNAAADARERRERRRVPEPPAPRVADGRVPAVRRAGRGGRRALPGRAT